MQFQGFPVAALDFYDDLEMDNTRSFWTEHRQVYEESVRAPMTALVAALAPEFAAEGVAPKVFRPYRDVRFRADKTPYKTHQGAFIPVAPRTGWYVEVSARGVRVGGGFYEASGARLAAIRAAMADDRTGPELERLVAGLEAEGFEINGEQLRTAPRGYPKDHPRIALLRHKQLFAGRSYGFEEHIHTPGLEDRVRADWGSLRPLLTWLATATDLVDEPEP